MSFNDIMNLNVGEPRAPKFVPEGDYIALCTGYESITVGSARGVVTVTFKPQTAVGGQDLTGIDLAKPKFVAKLWSSKTGNDDETFNRINNFLRDAMPDSSGPIKDAFESLVGNQYIVKMKHWQQQGRKFPELQVDRIRPA